MVNHYQYGIQDIEQLYPFERDIYYSLLQDHIKEVEEKTPDLILLDVILPDINGLELLKTFRENHTSDAMPIIMVSAFNDVDSISKCIQLGAQDYLPKPINGTILLAKVVAALERKFCREREKEIVN